MKNLPFNLDLGGKVVVVTGAGGVLCSSFAKTAAACNAKVAVLDLNVEAAQKVADEIVADGGVAIAVKANVLDKVCMEEAKAEIDAKLGSCDILINGAGGNNPKGSTSKDYLEEGDLENIAEESGIKTFFDLDPAGVSFVFNLNFLGTLIPTQVFAKDMADKKGGCILNISSMNAYTPLTKIPAYSAAKAGISNFTQWLATHFAGTGIRCNAIAPGFLVSAQNYRLLFNEDGTPTARSAKILNGTPMGRYVDASELLGATLFLCDDRSASAITGVVLPIDCGFAAYSGV